MLKHLEDSLLFTIMLVIYSCQTKHLFIRFLTEENLQLALI